MYYLILPITNIPAPPLEFTKVRPCFCINACAFFDQYRLLYASNFFKNNIVCSVLDLFFGNCVFNQQPKTVWLVINLRRPLPSLSHNPPHTYLNVRHDDSMITHLLDLWLSALWSSMFDYYLTERGNHYCYAPIHFHWERTKECLYVDQRLHR